ncbi:hypothetical protein SCHPADRAFT_911742 [Schizopora paradoxa]|uniref:Uncharacterized protein n=1 Tax=Schizopora paradoxa TaxID=27342 RepID=A0A0H2QZ59_9AGAM|nr:hypothetical protein SCHPADRAFT_911742 [Schizopora paradoxa]
MCSPHDFIFIYPAALRADTSSYTSPLDALTSFPRASFAAPPQLGALVQAPFLLTSNGNDNSAEALKSLSYISRATQHIVTPTPALSATPIFGPGHSDHL